MIVETEAEPPSRLLQPLTEVQLDLLELVWKPVADPEIFQIEATWPVWDFVARELYRKYPGLADASEILESLPRLPLATPYHSHPYGLVWSASGPAGRINPGDKIGLSIAGLVTLSTRRRPAAIVANGITAIIDYLAKIGDTLHALPNQVATTDVELSQLSEGFKKAHYEDQLRVPAIPAELIGQMLTNEYAPLSAFPFDGPNPKVTLDNRFGLRRFRATTAREYIGLVETNYANDVEPTETFLSSPLTLIQTLDYLGYVLAADTDWATRTSRRRLIAAPTLQTAAALGLTATNQYEFSSVMTSLCTLIDQMNVPPRRPEELAALPNDRARSDAARRMNCLAAWLDERLTDSEARALCKRAVKVLRDVRALRVQDQHDSHELQRKAVQSRRNLGLPDQITDWPTAWITVQQRLAGALNAIREQVQDAGTDRANTE